MIWGKIEQIITMEVYDAKGRFLGKQAKYIYKPILMWYELVGGLVAAFLIFTQIYDRW